MNNFPDNYKHMIKISFKPSQLYLIVILSINLFSCSEGYQKQDYKNEAAVVCDVFNPVHWQDLPADIGPVELQKIITQRLNAALKSVAMTKILRTITRIDLDVRYKYYAESVSKLIGEPHKCSYMKDYMTIII